MAAERVRAVILGSSFLVAWHNTNDVHHGVAARAMVVARTVGDALLAAGDRAFVPCSAIFADAFETFRAQARPDLSVADAAIATVARRQGAAVAPFGRGFRAHTDPVQRTGATSRLVLTPRRRGCDTGLQPSPQVGRQVAAW